MTHVIGGLVGLIMGALLGAIALIALIMFANSTFGLQEVNVGAEIGASVGCLLGFFFPALTKRICVEIVSSPW